jgi:Ca2+-binding EF-hand superfamily protein
MSIAGIGSQGSGNLSQILSSLLTKLDTTSKSTSTTSDTTSTNTTTTATDGGLTGSTKPSLSSMILGVLMQMQQSTSSTSATDSDDSTSATGTTGDNPMSKLFSAMDSDSDGSVTQSELESYITNAGGTTDEADQLYSQLASNSDSGITESDLANAAPPPRPHGGHGPDGPPPSDKTSDSAGSDLVSALDTDGDGTVSQDELSTYLTANGGTETQADTLFSSLSSDSSSITSSDFNDAIEKLASSFANNPYTSILNMLSTSESSPTSSGSSVSVSV